MCGPAPAGLLRAQRGAAAAGGAGCRDGCPPVARMAQPADPTDAMRLPDEPCPHPAPHGQQQPIEREQQTGSARAGWPEPHGAAANGQGEVEKKIPSRQATAGMVVISMPDARNQGFTERLKAGSRTHDDGLAVSSLFVQRSLFDFSASICAQ